MTRFSIEFRVGLLTILVLALVVFGIVRTDDKPGDVGRVWHVTADFPSIEGVYVSTPVRTAGVTIGSVEKVELTGNTAHVTLALLGNVQLAVDSLATLKGEGMLGDKSVKIVPGSSSTMLKEGDAIKVGEPPPDLEGLERQVGAITGDLKVITGNIREITDDDSTRQALMATVENVRALSEELRGIAAENGGDIAIIADNLRQVSEALKAVVDHTGGDVALEMEAIRKATEKLDATLQNLHDITAKVNNGDGTVGKLLNDSTTIDSVNDTLDDVNGIVADVSKLKTEVYYRGDYYLGTEPTDGALAANPVAGGSRNGIGIRIMPSEDHWYVVEFAGHPQGSISMEDHTIPEMGTQYREIVVQPSYRFSFQFAKRFNDLVMRFGIKDSGGGLGVDYNLFNDHFLVSADLFDFTYGSYPLLDGTPNLQVTARALPWRHLYVEGGLDNVILGAEHGYVTGFIGGGFYFDDKDVKYVMAALPVKP